jgi:pilus assembly protein Flp/PilA
MSMEVSLENRESHLEKKSQKGASLVEYALLVALVAVAGIAAMKLLGGNISSQFSTVAGQLG